MDLNEILVFTRVVQAGSFTGAAAVLRLPKSTVSRKVSELEQRLRARLLQRTTRKLSLTDAGRIYFDYCARIIAEVEDAERAIGTLEATPRGLLRVTAPVNASFLGPILADYMSRYPDVRVELSCTARIVDLVEERFDVGIRAGALADSSLIARSLGAARWLFVAVPAYAKKHGRPKSPHQLREHALILFGASDATTLHLHRGETSERVTVTPRMNGNDMDVLACVTLDGLGIGLLPEASTVEHLRAGRLERILPEWEAPTAPVHAVYPSTRHLSPKVRTFTDHLVAHMTPPPWELAPIGSRPRRGARRGG